MSAIQLLEKIGADANKRRLFYKQKSGLENIKELISELSENKIVCMLVPAEEDEEEKEDDNKKDKDKKIAA